jgi:hypothetical protein
MNNLPAIGAKIYYTGDMANPPCWTIVAALRPAGRFAGAAVDLTEIEGAREFKAIGPNHWAPAPGRRFVLEAVYLAERAAAIEAGRASLEAAAARYRATKEA